MRTPHFHNQNGKGNTLFIQKIGAFFADNANAPLDFNLFSFVEIHRLYISYWNDVIETG